MDATYRTTHTDLNQPQHVENRCSLSKVALIGLGIIFIISGAVAAGVLYSHQGYASLSYLAAIPVGIALIITIAVRCICASSSPSLEQYIYDEPPLYTDPIKKEIPSEYLKQPPGKYPEYTFEYIKQESGEFWDSSVIPAEKNLNPNHYRTFSVYISNNLLEAIFGTVSNIDGKIEYRFFVNHKDALMAVESDYQHLTFSPRQDSI